MQNKRMPKLDLAETSHFVDDYLPALLAQATHLIQGEFHRVVRTKGFTVSEWRVLATLASREPMSIGELAVITVTKQPTLTRVLDRMQARGEVERIPHEEDRRVTLVGITAAGSRAAAGLIKLARDHEHRVLEPFGLKRAADLKSTLKQMIQLHQGLAEEEGADED
jgi:DNA-binding MarR family transcriptional regulator